MNILLTGCAGFIGSHVLDRLIEDGHRVVGIDNFDPFYPREIKERNIAPHLEDRDTGGKFIFIESDLTEQPTYAKLDAHEFGQFDAIIHLAAKAGVRPSIEDPSGYLQANVVATHHLLEYAKANNIRQFVFASSSSVYGVNPKVPWSEDDTDLRPISPYASTKLCGENLGHVYSHLHGLRFLALRFFTVFGPRQRPDLAIHKFTRMIQNYQTIPMYGDGSTRRDYTYIDDIVDGILGALHYTDSQYEIINLGNNQTIELQEMIAQTERHLGLQANIEQYPEQDGDVPQTWAKIDKAQSLLGYSPKTSFEEGMYHFAEWFILKRNWLNKTKH